MTTVNIKRLDSVTNNDTAATLNINNNFEAVQKALESSLSRKADAPNFMDTELDMNSRRIINIGEPVGDGDVVNKKYVEDRITDAEAFAQAAAVSAEQAKMAKELTETIKVNVQETAGEVARDAAEVHKAVDITRAYNKYKPKVYADTYVVEQMFEPNSGDATYPYKAKVIVETITNPILSRQMTGYVIFNSKEAHSGNFAPYANFESGMHDNRWSYWVEIFAKEIPAEGFTIPTIAVFIGSDI